MMSEAKIAIIAAALIVLICDMSLINVFHDLMLQKARIGSHRQ